ncbi:unnamed protein product, partial [Brenthis ino]
MKVHHNEAINTRAYPGSDGQSSRAKPAKYAMASPQSGESKRSATYMRIATWNIGSLTGRSQELAEIHRRSINICCIQEIKWKGSKSWKRYLRPRY